MSNGNGEKTTTIEVYVSDKELLNKIKKLERESGIKDAVRKLIRESSYMNKMSIIEDKLEEIQGLIPEKIKDEEMGKIKRVEAIYKQVINPNNEFKSKGYKKLFEDDGEDKKKEEELTEEESQIFDAKVDN
jgi:predicted RNA binding protein with dsRBD fold (UPF0201 family)